MGKYPKYFEVSYKVCNKKYTDIYQMTNENSNLKFLFKGVFLEVGQKIKDFKNDFYKIKEIPESEVVLLL